MINLQVIEDQVEVELFVGTNVSGAKIFYQVDGDDKIFVGEGSAKRDATDNPNDIVGHKLAMGRALKDLGQKLTRDGYKLSRSK